MDASSSSKAERPRCRKAPRPPSAAAIIVLVSRQFVTRASATCTENRTESRPRGDTSRGVSQYVQSTTWCDAFTSISAASRWPQTGQRYVPYCSSELYVIRTSEARLGSPFRSGLRQMYAKCPYIRGLPHDARG